MFTQVRSIKLQVSLWLICCEVLSPNTISNSDPAMKKDILQTSQASQMLFPITLYWRVTMYWWWDCWFSIVRNFIFSQTQGVSSLKGTQSLGSLFLSCMKCSNLLVNMSWNTKEMVFSQSLQVVRSSKCGFNFEVWVKGDLNQCLFVWKLGEKSFLSRIRLRGKWVCKRLGGEAISGALMAAWLLLFKWGIGEKRSWGLAYKYKTTWVWKKSEKWPTI